MRSDAARAQSAKGWRGREGEEEGEEERKGILNEDSPQAPVGLKHYLNCNRQLSEGEEGEMRRGVKSIKSSKSIRVPPYGFGPISDPVQTVSSPNEHKKNAKRAGF